MKVEINNRVLVPFDYSEFCANSLQYALTMFDVDQVEVLHVARVPMANSPGVIWDKINEDTIRENCIKSFREFCEKHDLPENLSFHVKFGDPAEQIARFADEIKADMVFISSHGRKGIARWFLGSIAERVVRLAPCPVVVVKPDEVIKHRRQKLAEMDAIARSTLERETV